MGVKQLSSFLTDNHISYSVRDWGELTRHLGIEGRQLVVGIDTNIYVNKYIHSCHDPIYGLLQLFHKTIESNVFPIFILDGIASSDKDNEVNKRKKKLKKIELQIQQLEEKEDVDQDEIKKVKLRKSYMASNLNCDLKIVFDELAIPYIQSPIESDFLIGYLYQKGLIDTCLTNDSDVICAGCNTVIQHNGSSITVTDYNIMLDKMKISRTQLLEMIVLTGCDYFASGIRKSLTEIHKEMLEFESLEGILQNNPGRIENGVYFAAYERIRYIYDTWSRLCFPMFLSNNTVPTGKIKCDLKALEASLECSYPRLADNPFIIVSRITRERSPMFYEHFLEISHVL